jgi:hypothetical protein
MAGNKALVRRATVRAGAQMIIEFLITFHRTADTEILNIIRDCLIKVMDDNLNEFDEVVERMIIPRVERLGDTALAVDGNPYDQVLFGFALDCPMG